MHTWQCATKQLRSLLNLWRLVLKLLKKPTLYHNLSLFQYIACENPEQIFGGSGLILPMVHTKTYMHDEFHFSILLGTTQHLCQSLCESLLQLYVLLINREMKTQSVIKNIENVLQIENYKIYLVKIVNSKYVIFHNLSS